MRRPPPWKRPAAAPWVGRPYPGDSGRGEDGADPAGADLPLEPPAGRPPHEPAPGTRARPLTVAELNRSVQSRIESAYAALWIVGEVSNLSRRSSGHLYFTLKDASSEISAVMFENAARRLRIRPEDGAQVIVCGRPALWVPRGRYQFVAEEMEARGRGSLIEAFEALKQRLLAEGLFDSARKRPIPLLPCRIGIVTSPDGAALRDILKILRRRHAGVDVVIAPVRVQGDGAAEEVAAAIGHLGRLGGIDVLIVGRGGGSSEDLWTFNEEIVARAIATSLIPVVSAVGHETDVTIADFAADVRCATPSHAAEMVVACREDLAQRLSGAMARLAGSVRWRVGEARRRCERLARASALSRFPERLAEEAQRLDDRISGLASSLERSHDISRRGLLELRLRLAPRHLLEVVRRRRDAASDHGRRLRRTMETGLRGARTRTAAATGLLKSLSPLNVLDRGYAICLDPLGGTVVRSSTQVATGSSVEVRLARGELECRVVAARDVPAHDGPEEPHEER